LNFPFFGVCKKKKKEKKAYFDRKREERGRRRGKREEVSGEEGGREGRGREEEGGEGGEGSGRGHGRERGREQRGLIDHDKKASGGGITKHTPISIEGRLEKSKMALLKSRVKRRARSWMMIAAAMKRGRGEGPCKIASHRGYTRSRGKISKEMKEKKRKENKKKRREETNGE
jgi:hypothetical protein